MNKLICKKCNQVIDNEEFIILGTGIFVCWSCYFRMSREDLKEYDY